METRLALSIIRVPQNKYPVLTNVRTGRDSNPRLVLPNTRFPGEPDRPLRHLSRNFEV